MGQTDQNKFICQDYCNENKTFREKLRGTSKIGPRCLFSIQFQGFSPPYVQVKIALLFVACHSHILKMYFCLFMHVYKFKN